MPRTQTDIPTLLEAERGARKNAISSLVTLLGIYKQLDELGKQADRVSYRDGRYRRARHEFWSFVTSLKQNRRILQNALGALQSMRASSFVSPDDLIARVQADDDAVATRKARRQRRAETQRSLNA